MTKSVQIPVVSSLSAQNASKKTSDSSSLVRDCFTKKELIEGLTRVLTKLQDKWSKVAETPPKSTAIYEDVNLVRLMLEELK